MKPCHDFSRPRNLLLSHGFYNTAKKVEETLIKPRSSLQGGLNLIHETAARDDSASLPL